MGAPRTVIDRLHHVLQTATRADYPTKPLEHFEPVLRRVLAREPFV